MKPQEPIVTRRTVITPRGRVYTEGQLFNLLGCFGTWDEKDESCERCPLYGKCKSANMAIIILEES